MVRWVASVFEPLHRLDSNRNPEPFRGGLCPDIVEWIFWRTGVVGLEDSNHPPFRIAFALGVSCDPVDGISRGSYNRPALPCLGLPVWDCVFLFHVRSNPFV
jgi:hypothetical protein